MKGFIKILSLVLCLLLIIPTLFACKDKDKDDEGSKGGNSGIVDVGEVPGYKCTLTAGLKIYDPQYPEHSETKTFKQDIYFKDGDFFLSLTLEGETVAVTFCDEVLYLNTPDGKYKLDLAMFDYEAIIDEYITGNADGMDIYTEDMGLFTSPGVSGEGFEGEDTSVLDSIMDVIADGPASLIFKEVSESYNANGDTVTTYEGLNSKVAAAMDYAIAFVLKYIPEELSVDVDCDSLKITTVTDMFYDTVGASMSLDAACTVKGQPLNVEIDINTEYDYDDVMDIMAPLDAIMYKNIFYELLGELM